jgi:uncharacterized protein
MHGRWWLTVGSGALLTCHGLAQAAPVDDHRRGLQAYHRGDIVGAMAALRAGAKAGHAPSQAMLGYVLDRADFTEEAAAMYRSAALQGDADGHAGLAHLHATGRGVAKDEKLTLQHFSKAADLGHLASLLALAEAYQKNQWGLDADGRDAAAAMAAWRRAVEHRHVGSAQALARAYQRGNAAVAPDAAQAAAWQERAAALRASLAAPAASAVAP